MRTTTKIITETITTNENNPFGIHTFEVRSEVKDVEVPKDLSEIKISDEAARIVRQLEFQLREFNKTGMDLSGQVAKLPELIANKLYNARGTVSAEQLESWQNYFQMIVDFFTTLSQFEDPFPEITKLLADKSSLNISNIAYCLHMLHFRVVHPDYNKEFKARAIQCVLLSLEYEKILKCRSIDVKDISNLLIMPFQRLTKLGLFATDAYSNITNLKSQDLDQSLMQSIANAALHVGELKSRSKMIATSLNEIKETMEVLVKYLPAYSACKQEKIARAFVEEIVPFIMEAPFVDSETFSTTILDKIKREYSDSMKSKFIFPCDDLFYDFSIMLKKVETDKKDEVEKLINALTIIHEDASLDQDVKLLRMKIQIEETHDRIKAALPKFFGSGKSRLVDALFNFIHQKMKLYSTPIPLNIMEENDSNEEDGFDADYLESKTAPRIPFGMSK